MSSLNVREEAAPKKDSGRHSHHGSPASSLLTNRRYTVALSIAGAAIGAAAIAAGYPAIGIAIYIAVTLPFAFS
ncbi:hypothetical protein [Paraburkholderia sp.]|uniref:hypothetical protein n=1 Tax=Paraburkholderia sp. TaxID=1926495 RepID=UPI0023890A81|nr:hypothetical protein [Paraburkholderia sp.]MDE1182408.1 hypothetical protein [Paraburkholderia sp.]